MSEPYYADEYVTLYLGDCRELLPAVARGVSVVTDPPYGTGWVRGGGAVGEFFARRERPDWDRFDMSWVALVPEPVAFVVFGPASRAADLRASLPRPNRNVWWRKTNPRPNGPAREPICVWPANLPENIEFAAYNGDTPLHPAQKPLDLMMWAIQFTPAGSTVCDPFAGSGSTLVAARSLGRRAIGIEQNEEYCRIAADRLRNAPLPLFGAA